MKKTFKIDYRVFALGSVYTGKSIVVAKNEDEAIETLKNEQPSLINITNIEKGE